MDFTTIIILLAAGLAGGNAAAIMFPDKSLGLLRNSASGLVGSFAGAGGLASLIGTGNGLGTLIQHAAGGGTGGALLMIAAGFLYHRWNR